MTQAISVVFPAYNEEQNIETTITRAVAVLERLFDAFEIIIVNDASTDCTAEIAERLGQADNRISIIHNSTNLGQGRSLLKGLAEAKYDLVTHNAMDYPFDLEDLSKMLPLIESNDIVVGCRMQRAGYTFYRKVISRANLAFLHFLFDLKLRDYNFVQLYKQHVLKTITVKARSTGFVTPELLIRAHRKGFKIAEIPIKYLPREKGVARSGSIRVIASSTKDLIVFWLECVSSLRHD